MLGYQTKIILINRNANISCQPTTLSSGVSMQLSSLLSVAFAGAEPVFVDPNSRGLTRTTTRTRPSPSNLGSGSVLDGEVNLMCVDGEGLVVTARAERHSSFAGARKEVEVRSGDRPSNFDIGQFLQDHPIGGRVVKRPIYHCSVPGKPTARLSHKRGY